MAKRPGKLAQAAVRLDSWVNLVTGFGTKAFDKTAHTTFQPGCRLDDYVLTGLYNDNDLAGRIVDVYPREEMAGGFGLSGIDPKKTEDVAEYLKPLGVAALVTEARIWGRLYGGAAIFLAEDGADALRLREPLGDKPTIAYTRVIDRRYLSPIQWYASGPNVGKVELYNVSSDPISHTTIGTVHESRLIMFGGARTDNETRRTINGWELSVLQRPWEALRSAGDVWKASELQVTEANLGVYKLKNFWAMIAGQQQTPLINRLRAMDLAKGNRAILLDNDNEDYQKIANAFTGLPELNDRAVSRVAAAAEIPVTILMGEAPAGLNATGNSDLQTFYRRVAAERETRCEPQLLALVRILLQQKGSPVAGADLRKLGIVWHPMWKPTAIELADIRLKRAQEADVWIANQVITPIEAALSLDEEESGWTIDREAREEQQAAERELAAADPNDEDGELPDVDATKPDDGDDGEDGVLRHGKTAPKPKPQPKAAPGAPGATPAPAVGGPAGGENVQQQVLNGAQITSMIDVVARVANEEIPRESGIAILQIALQIPPADAERLMSTAGAGFKPKEDPAPAPFGGGPPGAGKPPFGAGPKDPQPDLPGKTKGQK